MKTGQSLVSCLVTENRNRFLSTTQCAVQSTRALTGYFSHELEHSTIRLVVVVGSPLLQSQQLSPKDTYQTNGFVPTSRIDL